MASSTLCILSVVSRHIMYLIMYCSNNIMFFGYVKQTITIPLPYCESLAVLLIPSSQVRTCRIGCAKMFCWSQWKTHTIHSIQKLKASCNYDIKLFLWIFLFFLRDLVFIQQQQN